MHGFECICWGCARNSEAATASFEAAAQEAHDTLLFMHEVFALHDLNAHVLEKAGQVRADIIGHARINL